MEMKPDASEPARVARPMTALYTPRAEPAFPVWLVEEEPARHQFVVALDETMRVEWSADLAERSPFDPVDAFGSTPAR